ncbi:MAG: acyl--CoA ligase [Lachnospiraceae bacterium]|nr:acyl--CoA ligase [Lachnospiraceae bacterium]
MKKSNTTTDEELTYNEVGEICLRTPNQMLGYFKDEVQTKEVIRTHSDGFTWVHTGDLGHVDEDGFIYVDGRIKEMITRHDGFKVYPSVIEKYLNEQGNVSQCKVVGVRDRKHEHGQIPTAFIVLKDGTYSNVQSALNELEHKCKQVFPEYYMESCVFRKIDALPLTSIGKVDYRLLQRIAEKNENR